MVLPDGETYSRVPLKFESVLYLPQLAGVGRINMQGNKTKIEKERFHHRLFFLLLIAVFVLGSLNVAKAKGLFLPAQPEVKIDGNSIDLSSFTLEQKIAQMIIVSGATQNIRAWKNLQVGGIHLIPLKDAETYREVIAQYQEGMAIPFFVTVDGEGCINPFAHFREFIAAKDITREGEAFEKGVDEGKFMKSLGVTTNFAPVVDLQDGIWKCRTFPGNETAIAGLAEAYALGLQKEGIMSTAKHYPGKTLIVRDPHKFVVAAEIDPEDIVPFREIGDTVNGVMVSHVITTGVIDSNGIPAVASQNVLNALHAEFPGLIVSDEINMLGLRGFYLTLDEMYIAVFNAGNDIIINFNEDPQEIYRMITVIRDAVDRGEVSEERIDSSVRKILQAKGFTVLS